MTREGLDQQLGRLVALRGMPTNSDGYWEVLDDIPEVVLINAIGHALKTRVWFPTPAEIRMDCDHVRVIPDTVYVPREPEPTDFKAIIKNPLPECEGHDIEVTVGRDWADDCDECRDTGWAMRRCAGADGGWIRQCGRLPPKLCQYPHVYTVKCPCIPTNPTIQRRYEAAKKYAQEPARLRR